ncbi:MAG: multiheme c-type cytochrome [Deferrisomatales bacterium]|nr:multiheme c-type cytochrome [Deferrisomatales bacterium]
MCARDTANDIDCSACHGDGHTSATEVAKVRLPTPDTCGECHEDRVKQYRKGKHAKAWLAMNVMPTTHNLPSALIAGQKRCGGCHKIGEKSADEIQQPRPTASPMAPRRATAATPATPSR